MNLNVKRLTVKYNDLTVGFLEELSNGEIAFQYDLDWLKNGFSISPFSLPLEDRVFISKSEYFGGLFGVFNDSLPDGWGELLVRRMLFKKGLDFDKISILTKLSLLGNNGLGGLNYVPTQSVDYKDKFINLDQLAEEIKILLGNKTLSSNFDLIYELGGASGGARPKVHVEIKKEEWIIKFPSSIDPINIGEEEYQANLAASSVGIDVNEFKLFPSKKSKGYFGAKRFDRLDGRRVHMISLSSLLETTHKIPTLDYVHLFQVVKKICVNKDDLYEAFRRMCFNVIYGNKDDHGKNFAFIYDEELKGYKISPFYDITKTKDKVEHEMTVFGEGNPDQKLLLEVAKEFDLSIKTCKNIISRVSELTK